MSTMAWDQPRDLRLTRRGRLVVFLACVAVAVFGLFSVAGTAIGSGERGELPPVRVVHVQPGDTLWDIATRVSPGSDPRELVAEIRWVNALPDGSLRVGDEIAVPTG